MFAKTAPSLLLLASLASAHFTIEYPEMRGDSFADGASQWIYPCANVNQTAQTNRTLWPLTGGSVNADLHHPWTYLFINLGLGTTYPTFNISLTRQLLNVTGNGTFCLPQLTLPAGVSVSDGQNASIQVVTVGQSGSALYNCADITFSSTATILSGDACTNSTGVTGQLVGAATATNTSSAANSSSTPSAASGGFSVSLPAGVVGLSAAMMSFLL